MRIFYDTTVEAFAHCPDVDVDAYEAKSFAIFRKFGPTIGVGEEAMVSNLKLIPRQMVAIVKEDPTVLESYDNFWTAVARPD